MLTFCCRRITRGRKTISAISNTEKVLKRIVLVWFSALHDVKYTKRLLSQSTSAQLFEILFGKFLALKACNLQKILSNLNYFFDIVFVSSRWHSMSPIMSKISTSVVLNGQIFHNKFPILVNKSWSWSHPYLWQSFYRNVWGSIHAILYYNEFHPWVCLNGWFPR